MAENSHISWTDNTFNPWQGCTKISPGCKHCYAETLSARWGNTYWGDHATRGLFKPSHFDLLKTWNAKAEKLGVRTKVFCASMADIADPHPVLTEVRQTFWHQIMHYAGKSLIFQLLTKRPELLREQIPREYLTAGAAQWEHVWLGVSIETRAYLWRLNEARKVPARLHFISLAPLLEPITFAAVAHADWIIIEGESAKGKGCARALNLDATLRLIEQAQAAGVPIFIKQLGTVAAKQLGLKQHKGDDPTEWPDEFRVQEFPNRD